MNAPEDNGPSTDPKGPSVNEVDTGYLTICEVLGFSSRLLSDFDATLEVYRE